jgi:hypothetical protein
MIIKEKKNGKKKKEKLEIIRREKMKTPHEEKREADFVLDMDWDADDFAKGETSRRKMVPGERPSLWARGS